MDIVEEMQRLGSELIEKYDLDFPLPNWRFRHTGPMFSPDVLQELLHRAGLRDFKFEITWPGDGCHIFFLPENEAKER